MKKFLSTAKGKIIVIAAALLIAAAALIIILRAAKTESYRSISISALVGTVTADNNGNKYKAYENMRLTDGISLTTEADSNTSLLLDDDKFMRLEEKSRALFKGVGSANDRRTSISLEYGTLKSDITQPLKSGEEFVVNTPNAILAVRGTFFVTSVSFDEKGEVFTDVYTYGGSVSCRRIFPDGSLADENVLIDGGYKARVKMDEIITVYVEESIEEKDIDPIVVEEIPDKDIVEMFDSSNRGHELFLNSEQIKEIIDDRNIDTSLYISVFDNKPVSPEIPQPAAPPAPVSSSSAAPAASSVPVSSAVSVSSSESSSESEPSQPPVQPDPPYEQPAEPPIEPPPVQPTTPPASSSSSSSSSSSAPSAPPASVSSSSSSTPSAAPEQPVTPPASSSSSSSSSSEPSEPAEPEAPSYHVHSFTEPVAYDPPTCTEDGRQVTACACGIRETIIIVSTGHTEITRTTPADCTKAGSTAVVCEVCGEVLSETELPASGHTEITRTTPATCTKTGSTAVVCEVCGEVLSETELPLLPHEPVTERTEPTAFEDGRELVTCAVCGEVLSDEVLPATGLEINAENFPDEVFRRYVSDNFDTDSDGYLSEDECAAVTTIDVAGTSPSDDGGVESLKGIEHFTGLKTLSCSYNSGLSEIDISSNRALKELKCLSLYITNLDLRNNTELTYLDCSDTDITSLDVSQNVKLEKLHCFYTDITSLDIGTNTALTSLWCQHTNLTNLDLSRNTALKALDCRYTGVAYLDLTNNSALKTARITGNKYVIPSNATSFDLTTIDGFDISRVSNVQNAAFDSTTGMLTNITDDVTYTYDCGQGYSETFTLTRTGDPADIEINATNFPDDAFRRYVSNNFDTDSDGMLSPSEIAAATEITVDYRTNSLKGVEYFTALTNLNCYHSRITSLDISNNTALEILNVSASDITSLDVSHNTALRELNCAVPGITSLDVSNNPQLELLDCILTSITSLDVRNNPALKTLYCYKTNITELDVSMNTALKELRCYYTGITSLDISNNTALTELMCDGLAIRALDTSNNTALETLSCCDAGVAYLDLTNNTALTTVDISGNKYAIPSNATSFNVIGNYDFKDFDPSRVSNLQNAQIDSYSGNFFNITGDVTYTYDCGLGIYRTFTLARAGDPSDIEINAANFPDPAFMQYVYSHVDTNNDGVMSQSEIAAVTEIDVSGEDIYSLKGIEHFTALEELKCANTKITSLDVRNNTALERLDCVATPITSLDLSQNAALTFLNCTNSAITSLDVSNNTALTILTCNGTSITSIDVSQNTALKELELFDTNVTSLDVRNNTALETLDCSGTGITSLDISSNTALTYLNCNRTNITSLDVSQNTALGILHCSDTGITSLDVSNNTALTELMCDGLAIRALDTSNNTALIKLFCKNTGIAYLDITNNTALTTVSTTGNKYVIPSNATHFNVQGNPDFAGFDPSKVSNLQNADIDANSGNFFNITGDVTYTYGCGRGYSETFTLTRTGDPEGIAVTAANFPDDVFRQYVSDNFDINSDGYLTDIECAMVTEIDVSATYPADGGVTSLEGVEHFNNLGILNCGCNLGLTELDVSRNTALTKLICRATNINGLDLSKNTELNYLDCCNTSITSLDLSHNTALKDLWCTDTNIAFLDLTNNTALAPAIMDSNKYIIPSNATTFDFRDIDGFDITRVSNVIGAYYDTSTGILTNITGDVTYTYYCGQGQSATFTLTRTGDPEGIAVTAANFPDPVFMQYVSDNFDTDNDGYLTDSERAVVTEIDVSGTASAGGGVTSLEGIEHFTNLTSLNCRFNFGLTSLDVCQNTALTKLYCNNTGITSLDVSKNTALEELRCNTTSITSLDVSQNSALKILSCNNTSITSLDVSENTALESLYCYGTGITSLDVSKNTALIYLYCQNTSITSLDVGKNTALTALYCYSTDITSLDVSRNTALTYLYCFNTGITSLDVSNNTALIRLDCYNTGIAYLDLTNNTALTSVSISDNKYVIPSNATTFDLSAITGFDVSKMSDLNGATLDGTVLTINAGATEITYTYDCGQGYSRTFTLTPTGPATRTFSATYTNQASEPLWYDDRRKDGDLGLPPEKDPDDPQNNEPDGSE